MGAGLDFDVDEAEVISRIESFVFHFIQALAQGELPDYEVVSAGRCCAVPEAGGIELCPPHITVLFRCTNPQHNPPLPARLPPTACPLRLQLSRSAAGRTLEAGEGEEHSLQAQRATVRRSLWDSRGPPEGPEQYARIFRVASEVHALLLAGGGGGDGMRVVQTSEVCARDRAAMQCRWQAEAGRDSVEMRTAGRECRLLGRAGRGRSMQHGFCQDAAACMLAQFILACLPPLACACFWIQRLMPHR